MRILLDECIDEELRHSFIGHDLGTLRPGRVVRVGGR